MRYHGSPLELSRWSNSQLRQLTRVLLVDPRAAQDSARMQRELPDPPYQLLQLFLAAMKRTARPRSAQPRSRPESKAGIDAVDLARRSAVLGRRLVQSG